MATKTSGKELKAFYADASFWKEGVWHEDEEILVNGQAVEDLEIANLNDTDEISIAGGYIFGPDWTHTEGPSFESFFRRWKKQQTTVTFVVQCDLNRADAIKAAIRVAGGHIS